MNNSTLLNQSFLSALTKIMGQPLSIPVAIRLKNIQISLVDQEKKYKESYKAILTEALTPEQLELYNNKKEFTLTDEIQASIKEKDKELRKVEFKCATINVNELGNISLSAGTLIQLKDIIIS